jgi:hypothetical protein
MGNPAGARKKGKAPTGFRSGRGPPRRRLRGVIHASMTIKANRMPKPPDRQSTGFVWNRISVVTLVNYPEPSSTSCVGNRG